MKRQRNPLSAALPDHKTTKGDYLYAVEFHDGSVKIGVTWNPSARVPALCGHYRRRAVKAHATLITGKAFRHDVERKVLERCRVLAQPLVGKELFAGLHYGSAVTLIEQMARRDFARSFICPSRTKEARKKTAVKRALRKQAEQADRFARVVAALSKVA
jgi:hypothetical protein